MLRDAGRGGARGGRGRVRVLECVGECMRQHVRMVHGSGDPALHHIINLRSDNEPGDCARGSSTTHLHVPLRPLALVPSLPG